MCFCEHTMGSLRLGSAADFCRGDEDDFDEVIASFNQ